MNLVQEQRKFFSEKISEMKDDSDEEMQFLTKKYQSSKFIFDINTRTKRRTFNFLTRYDDDSLFKSMIDFSLVSDFDLIPQIAKYGLYELDDKCNIKVLEKGNEYLSINESFIAMNGVNKLRYLVPNFSYIFGFSKFKKDTYNVTNHYTITENIQGNPMTFYLSDAYKTMRYLIQVLYALAIAEKMFNFTHYDLTCDNVIIRDVREMKIPLYGKQQMYMMDSSIATIINYEYSTIKFDGKQYGVKNGFVGSDKKCFALFDCFKLLMSLLENSIDKYPDTYNYLVHAFYFFSEEDPINILTSGTSWRNFLPRIEKFKEKTVYDFIDYICSTYVVDFIKNETTLVKGDFLLNPMNVTNSFQYYDMYKFIESNKDLFPKRKELRSLYNSYRYEEKDTLDMYSKLISEFDASKIETDPDVNDRDKYIKYLSEFIVYYSKYMKLAYYTQCLEFVTSYYEARIPNLDIVNVKLSEHKVVINQSIEELLDDIDNYPLLSEEISYVLSEVKQVD